MKKNNRSCARCVEVPEGNLLVRVLEVNSKGGSSRFNIYVTLMTIGLQLAAPGKKIPYESTLDRARHEADIIANNADEYSRNIITAFAESFFGKLPVDGDDYYSVTGEGADMDMVPGHMARIEFIEQCVLGNVCEIKREDGTLVEDSHTFIKLTYGITKKAAVA